MLVILCLGYDVKCMAEQPSGQFMENAMLESLNHGDNITLSKRLESTRLNGRVSDRLTTMIIEQLQTKLENLNMKITARILEKIGTISYIVPDDENYVTSETLQIGTVVGMGKGLIGTAAGAASKKAGVGKYMYTLVLVMCQWVCTCTL